MPDRNKYKNHQHTGFTLIELLVVISIITLLSSIALATFKSAKDNAGTARIELDAHAIETQFDITRDAKNEVVGDIINNWCRACEFDSYKTLSQQPGPESDNDGDWRLLGFPNGAPRDPWGNPYLLDANENEPNFPCGRMDTVMSAGPDGYFQIQSYVVNFIPNPGQIYSAPGFDDKFFFISLFQCQVPAIPG